MGHFHDDEDEIKEAMAAEKKVGKKDFDCPSCNANNPLEEPYGEGSELLCNYCGAEYLVKINSEGKPKFKEV